ncbi:bifunctional tRNA pseudouridine(32) synthase/23S rRNA pseudouridine(746) synthase RluA [Labrenzia sp. PHM005]|uniref:bifunctional tRNA pseudouridine(32) synthase/23S rRNA pseudouridine(746) synthase RluA n=1 Tax=Labrenzia sp. PHM005 TaxID=2590016 RepID=UPI00113FD96F|nr:bifunctional tRNA pseudouridine(32) synthase/23S rRNA pseudouridine(746) synthase RluA [Labrenzia sp. PHM005]QDG75698.1 bifunctional tRNA pseudouridine(32) synthase/23S rRNA pseudouridine(746) synthase RluA [Labrenzia sp. PHM005]
MNQSAPAPFVYNPPLEPYLSVLHVDEDLLIVDKPSGLLSVPGKALEHSDCVESRAQKTYPDARIVHRLDMDTSGVMVLAMNAAAHRHLGLQFERRKTQKTYLAEVWGHIAEDEGEVDLPLICDWPNRPKQMVCFENGKPALTKWQVLDRRDQTTRLRLFPYTGRSHQLRVHMLALGHPIIGDRFYANGEALAASSRLALHAESLTLHHPVGGERVRFEAACPF